MTPAQHVSALMSFSRCPGSLKTLQGLFFKGEALANSNLETSATV